MNGEYDDFYPSKEEYVAIIEFLKKLARESKLLFYSEHAYDMMLKALNDEEVKFNCMAGSKFCYLNPDGRIMPTLHIANESVDGTKMGFVNAFYQLKHQHSSQCFNLCLPEKNVMHKLDFSSISRYLPILIKQRVIF